MSFQEEIVVLKFLFADVVTVLLAWEAACINSGCDHHFSVGKFGYTWHVDCQLGRTRPLEVDSTGL